MLQVLYLHLTLKAKEVLICEKESDKSNNTNNKQP